jgi:hypothetical protein
MERKIPNRSVENTGQFLVLALLAAHKETIASSNYQSNGGDGRVRYF